jgi:NAD kinase
VIDGGMQFRSSHLESFCALHGISIKVRSCFDPRYGGRFERLFGMSKAQLISTLGGDTQILKNVRRATKAQNPAEPNMSALEGEC